MMSSLLLFLFTQNPDLQSLNQLLAKKDIVGLKQVVVGDGNELKVLAGGAYSVGQFGWKAVELGSNYVVFTTPLTSEDIGELLFERTGNKLKYIPETQKDGLRIRHQKLKVKFAIPKKEVWIEDEVNVEIKPSNMKFHVLRFSPCYKIASITDGKKAVPFEQAGGIVKISKQPTGDQKLFLVYSGKVDLPQYAGSITPNVASLTNDYWYPMSNRMPSTYDITVYPPDSEWQVVAQGKYMGKTSGEKEVGEKFRMDLPAIYWSLTVGKLKFHSERIADIDYDIWTRSMTDRGMKMQSQLNAPIIEHYSKNFSKYPFSRWGSLDSPTYGGGALEAYSYATYGEGWLPDEDPHEPAHTWFGGILPNTYLNSFWNESFAVWCEGFYAREVALGNKEERREAFAPLGRVQLSYDKAPLMKSGVDIGAAASDLGYGKGAKVLSMLEQIVGTQNMLKVIQTWIAEHPKGEPAEWEDFERVCYKILPQFKLNDFFDDWFRRPGYAAVELKNTSTTFGSFKGTLAFKGPGFRMLIEVWLENSIGGRERHLVDTAKCDENGNFELKTGTFKPVRVYLDPYHKALRTGTSPDFKSFADVTKSFKVYRDPKQPEMCEIYVDSKKKLTDELEGTLLIGHPDTLPVMKTLCGKAGFAVKGNVLTYKGTTIDLEKAAAFAVVELENGKQCAIGIGTCERVPNLGNAHAGLVEKLGRFLRGSVRFPGRASEAIELK